MSDREDEPTDIFDVVCRLDDLADWLTHPDRGYYDEAATLRLVGKSLRSNIVIELPSSILKD